MRSQSTIATEKSGYLHRLRRLPFASGKVLLLPAAYQPSVYIKSLSSGVDSGWSSSLIGLNYGALP